MARKLLKSKVIIGIILIICLSCMVVIMQPLPVEKKKPNDNQLDVSKKQNKPKIDDGKEGSIDVLAVGNSDLFSGFNPLQLWNEQGITSYAAGASMQNMSTTYYMIEKILTVQKPKVIILELDNFFETRGNENKSEAIEMTLKTAYPLFMHSAYWDIIKDKPYVQKEKANQRTFLRGYYYKTEVEGNEEGYSYLGWNIGEEPMVPYTEKYFSKIMDLAKENNSYVIFLCFPSKTSWSYRKHNTVSSYAKKYNVPFLDMNIDNYGTGFNWMTDTRDAGNHLNHSGATKVTKFIGEYLAEHYDLVDHRGNPKFIDWDEDSKKFKLYLKNEV